MSEETGIDSVTIEKYPKSNFIDNIYSKKTRQVLLISKSTEEIIPTTSTTIGDINNFAYIEDVKLPPGALVYSGIVISIYNVHMNN